MERLRLPKSFGNGVCIRPDIIVNTRLSCWSNSDIGNPSLLNHLIMIEERDAILPFTITNGRSCTDTTTRYPNIQIPVVSELKCRADIFRGPPNRRCYRKRLSGEARESGRLLISYAR